MPTVPLEPVVLPPAGASWVRVRDADDVLRLYEDDIFRHDACVIGITLCGLLTGLLMGQCIYSDLHHCTSISLKKINI